MRARPDTSPSPIAAILAHAGYATVVAWCAASRVAPQTVWQSASTGRPISPASMARLAEAARMPVDVVGMAIAREHARRVRVRA